MTTEVLQLLQLLMGNTFYLASCLELPPTSLEIIPLGSLITGKGQLDICHDLFYQKKT
jgi:hypothetical protein